MKEFVKNIVFPIVAPVTASTKEESTTPSEPIRKNCPHYLELVLETTTCPFCKQAIFSFDVQKNAWQGLIIGGISFIALMFAINVYAQWEVENVHMP